MKNLFVVLPLFFSGSILDTGKVYATAVAFLAFTLIAGAVYCLNDIIDVDSDRAHPRKSLRPIAAGDVSIAGGYATMAVALVIALAVCWLLPDTSAALRLMAILVAYFIINVAYCFWLKTVAIVDIFTIASGFVLRIFAGGTAAGIEITEWLVLMTFLLALFIALGKRHDDVVTYMKTGEAVRKSTRNYNLDFINQMLTLTSSVTMVCYIMYCLSEEVTARLGSKYVYLTAVFVLAGIGRYLQQVLVFGNSASPTKLLWRDRFMQLCIIGWAATFFIIIYILK